MGARLGDTRFRHSAHRFCDAGYRRAIRKSGRSFFDEDRFSSDEGAIRSALLAEGTVPDAYRPHTA